MKLTYIANARVPSEKAHPYQILKMCEALGERVDIRLVLPFRVEANKQLRQITDWAKYYGLKKRIKTTKLPSFDLIWLDLYTLKLGHLRFHLQAFSFAFLATLYSSFKKADIYYTREHPFASLFGSLKSLHGRRIYYEAHDFGRLVSRLVKKGKVDGLVVITNKLKELYIKEGIPEGKILVAPDGVDLKMFDANRSREEAKSELGIPSGKKAISYIGHLYDWKGAHILALSTKHMPDNYISYFIGGMSGDLVKFKEFIRRNETTNTVVAGYVPPLVVPKYLAASDVLVLPNIEKGLSHFTSPLKLFEYMASRRPIVASDLPAIREILNEENAILVEPGNPKALAEGIKKVLQDEELATKVADNAYKDVQQYSWDKRAERILAFIGETYDKERHGKQGRSRTPGAGH